MLILADWKREVAAAETAYEAITAVPDASAQQRILDWLTARLGAEWTFRLNNDEEPPF